MEWNLILAGLVGLFGLFLMGSVLLKPLRFLMRLVFYIVVGVVLLLVINFVLGQMGVKIALNPFTVLTAGTLQLPGVVLLIVLNCLFAA